MARKKAIPTHENHERWLVSYADFITLLFAFFVVMFASSQTDKAKAQQVSDSVKEALEKGGVSSRRAGDYGRHGGREGQRQRDDEGSWRSPAEPEGRSRHAANCCPRCSTSPRPCPLRSRKVKLRCTWSRGGWWSACGRPRSFLRASDTIDQPLTTVWTRSVRPSANCPTSCGWKATPTRFPSTRPFRSNWELSAARSIAMLGCSPAVASSRAPHGDRRDTRTPCRWTPMKPRGPGAQPARRYRDSCPAGRGEGADIRRAQALIAGGAQSNYPWHSNCQ